MNPDSKDDNSFRYCGEYYDKETEEIYLRARYYEPNVGRFLTRDTYTGEDDEPESLHLYTYCENDGINSVDPSGHDAVWLQYAYGAIHMGHTGLALQDINGQWYYFFWGSSNNNAILNFFFKPYAKRYLEPIASLTKYRKKPKKLKRFVYQETQKYYDQKVTGTIYFQGDFSESYTYLRDYRGCYNTKSNNCLQVCLRALDYGIFKNNTKNLKGYAVRRVIKENYIIPNNAFARLKKLLGK